MSCSQAGTGVGQHQVTLYWLPAGNLADQASGPTGGFWEASELQGAILNLIKPDDMRERAKEEGIRTVFFQSHFDTYSSHKRVKQR